MWCFHWPRALSGSAFSYKEVPLPRGKAKWKLRTWEQKIQNEFSKGKQPQRRINGPWPLEKWPELPGSLPYEALPTDPGGPPPPPQCLAEMFPAFNTTASPPMRTASPFTLPPRDFPSHPHQTWDPQLVSPSQPILPSWDAQSVSQQNSGSGSEGHAHVVRSRPGFAPTGHLAMAGDTARGHY